MPNPIRTALQDLPSCPASWSSADPRRRNLWTLALAVLCALLVVASPGFAQVSGGSITGTLTDSTGAVVTGATVTIVNRGTGVSQTLTTNSTGLFNKPNLDPGNYEVTFTASGFATIRTEVLVDVGHDTVLDLQMKISTGTEVVNVTAASTSVDLGSTQLNQTVDGKTLRELPLNGRDWTSLSILEPNVHTVDNQLSISSGDNTRSNRGVGTQISIGGTRPQQNNYRLDGITTNDYSGAGPGGALGGTLGVDAIQEFTVVTSNASSDYGRTSGGVVSAVTRQGTNRFHGSGYEFIRNSALDAKNYFSTTSAPFKRNQFGGTIGGPIHKDRAFFFFNYEGLRQNRTTATIDTVPSPNASKGLLQCTQTATASNKNCLTGPGGTLEPAGGVGLQQFTIDPNVAPYLALYPQPNAGINGDTGTWTFNSEAVAKENLVTGRADYTFSPRDAIHATALNDTSTDSQPDGFNFVLTGLDITRRVYSVQEQHVISSSMVNFLHGGYAYTFSIAPASSSAINPLASNQSLGFVPGANVGEIQIGGISTFFGGVNAEGVYSWHYHSYQAGDDFYLTKGNHSVQTGFSYERDQSNDLGNVTNGFYVFGSFASFLGNAPTSFTSNIPGHSIPIYLRQNVFGAYLMDTYHARKNLTVTVGARYEPITPVGEKYGHLGVMLNPTDPAPTVVSSLYQNPSLLNISPRLGVVWDPFGAGKTSVRASYGIYDTLPLSYMFTLNTVSTAPYGSTANLTSAPVGSFGAYSTNTNNPKLAYNLAIANPTNKVAYIQQKFSRPYLEQYMFNIQQQLATGLNLEIGYTGSHGVRQPLKSNDGNIVEPLPTSTFRNMIWPAIGTGTPTRSTLKLNPAVGTEDTTMFIESTSYNALNVALRGSGRNYRLGVSYTWSKSLDESSSSNGGTNFTNSLIAPFPNYIGRFKGPSDFNIQQNAVVNGLYTVRGFQNGNAFVRGATGGYQLGGVVRVATGLPFTPLVSGDPLGLASANTFQFPDRLYGPGCQGNPTSMAHKNDYQFLNRDCFAYPLPIPGPNGTYFPRMGNLARNSIYGPGITTVDLSAVKSTAVPRFGEQARVEFRAEAFNLLNHPNFSVPSRANSVIYKASANPAVVGATSNLQQLTTTSTAERQIQFGLKLIF
jgi:hypothetical protein